MMSIFLPIAFSTLFLLGGKKQSFSFIYLYSLSLCILMKMLFTGTSMKIISGMLGFDCLSLSLLILSFWISVLMILSSSMVYKLNNQNNMFSFLVMLILISLMFSFSSMNMMMFYFFFEFSLIPTLLMILGWGYQPERIQAGIYFLFYTLTASLPLLLSLMYIYFMKNTLFFLLLYTIPLDSSISLIFMFSLLMAFLVKMPLFLFHLWLPKAHVEAPVAGSMILAGVLLKLGGFGLCRVMSLVSESLMKFNSYMVGLCLFSMVYVGLMCCRLNDLKALVAYSSVSHMSLVVCGAFSYYYLGFSGCLLMMVAHGICSSGLFSLVNMYYERSHSRSIFLNKGMILVSSIFTMMFFFLCVSNISAPPSLSLVSEIFLMASVMNLDFFMILVFPLGSFLGTVFTMYLFSNSQHGKIFGLMSSNFGSSFSEYNILFLHVFPLNFMVLVPEYFFLY